jgi:hypothetical protein
MPCLMKAVEKTTGDILELGTGLFSTPYLHYVATLYNRRLVSYENFPEWGKRLLKHGYENKNHEIYLIDKYADAPIDREWDIVLIDQTPDSSRSEEIRRLKDKVKYIIIHDANKSNDRVTHYSTIYPLFKYRTDWTGDNNSAVVLSNLVDLEDFWK